MSARRQSRRVALATLAIVGAVLMVEIGAGLATRRDAEALRETFREGSEAAQIEALHTLAKRDLGQGVTRGMRGRIESTPHLREFVGSGAVDNLARRGPGPRQR